MSLTNLDPHPSQYKSLPLVLSLFALSLFLLTGLLAVMEKAGIVIILIEALMTLLPLLVFAIMGVLFRTMKLSEFHWSGKSVPAGLTGITLAACFVGGSFFPLFLTMTYLSIQISFPILLGWASSLVLCATLFASPVRKINSATIPEFLGARLQSKLVRLLSSLLLVLVALPLLCAELLIGGEVLSTSLNGSTFTSILLLSLVLLISVVLGGVSGAVWTQALQAVFMVGACMLPVILLFLDQVTAPASMSEAGFTGLINTSLTEQLVAIAGIGQSSIGRFLTTGQYAGTAWPLVGTILLFASGMASMPHLLTKYQVTEDASSSRRAAGYALSFLLLLIVLGSSYFLMLSDERLQSLLGPNALEQGHHAGLIAALIRSGIVAAVLAASSALLMAISTSISRDIIESHVLPRTSLNQKMILARVIVICVCALSAYLTYGRHLLFLDMLVLSISLAAAIFFPVLLLSCWWSKLDAVAACCAMIVGCVTTVLYALVVNWGATGLWFGLPAEMGGLLGVILGCVTGISLSYLPQIQEKERLELTRLIEQPNTPSNKTTPSPQSNSDGLRTEP